MLLYVCVAGGKARRRAWGMHGGARFCRYVIYEVSSMFRATIPSIKFKAEKKERKKEREKEKKERKKERKK